MKIEDIQQQLSEAWHEIGHARAFVGEGRMLAASMAVDRAREALKTAYDELEKIQA